MHLLFLKFKHCSFKEGQKSIWKNYHFCQKKIMFSKKKYYCTYIKVSVLFPLLPSKALLCVHTWSQVEFLTLFCGHLLKKKFWIWKKCGICKPLNLVAKPNDVFSFPCWDRIDFNRCKLDAKYHHHFIYLPCS